MPKFSPKSFSKLFSTFRKRRIAAVATVLAVIIGLIFVNPASYEQFLDQTVTGASVSDSNSNVSGSRSQNSESKDLNSESETSNSESQDSSLDSQNPNSEPKNPNSNPNSANSDSNNPILARAVLEKLPVKGRAPKTGYKRDEFYKTWPDINGCSLRQRILRRDLGDSAQLAADECTVVSGEFTEPYTGQHLIFSEKSAISKGLQIDHVVALSDAWQKGAQSLSASERFNLATDPLNLLAVDSGANQGKSDGDAATWLPKNKSFRCQYVARQISVKYKYHLWVTSAEHDAIAKILETCPSEPAVGITEL